MDDIEIVTKFFESIETKDWHSLREIISEDFQFHGPTPDPIDKETWLDFQIAIESAFPDWAFNIQKIERIHDAIEATVHITATHKHALNLPIEGFPSIQPTQREIHLPIEHVLVKVSEGKIVELIIEQQLHGSLLGLLEQLGME